MPHVDPIFMIFGMAIFGILFFNCLIKSIKMKTKFWKITYLILAVLFSVIVMECILRFILDKEPAGYLNTALFYVMRIIQGLFCLLGLLMSIGISLHKYKTLKTS